MKNHSLLTQNIFFSKIPSEIELSLPLNPFKIKPLSEVNFQIYFKGSKLGNFKDNMKLKVIVG